MSQLTASMAGEASGVGAVRQAVVLAGGAGSRLRPLTLSLPKPMVDPVDSPWRAINTPHDLAEVEGELAGPAGSG
nr:hypothetical protein KPHV_82530 [Kitasatospora purpeofusca]